MTAKADLSGRRIGEFVLLERLDEGGFGAVYRCEQPALGREAVVKILHRRLRRRDVHAQRFLREAKLASWLHHPYAAHVYAFGVEEDGLLWIAMEFVQGVTLARWLTVHGPMPLGQFVTFFERIVAVVQTAHEHGIVHRDLKPSNVMVIERAGELLPKLLDFGVAKLLDSAVLPEGIASINYLPLPATDDVSGNSPAGMVRIPGKSTVTDLAAAKEAAEGAEGAPLPGGQVRLTPDSHTVGSPPYMSPEQWVNAVAVGPASDLYALAVVAFEALTGRRPFQGTTAAEYAGLHRHAKVPALGGSFPPALDRMFQRALAKRPEDRWRTALELAGELRAASGIGATRSDLPRIDQDVCDAWLAQAPQPLAESVAVLGSACNAHQAHIATQELTRNLLRYLLAMALVTQARAREGKDDLELLELIRVFDKRDLGLGERVRLLRLLVGPQAGEAGDPAVPELRELLIPKSDGTDVLDPILALHTAAERAVTEDGMRLQLLRLIPELTQLLRKARFVLDYTLVVLRGHAAERWVGRRAQPRALVHKLDGELVEEHPVLLDRAGRVCVDLWPLVQVVQTPDDVEPELFLFDGYGRHDAILIAAPAGLECHDPIARDWLVAKVIAEIETRTWMRAQIRVAARQWQERNRPGDLLWRGDALADLERWMGRTAGVALLSEIEVSFVAASCRAGRRARLNRRLLVVLAIAAALAGIEYRAWLQTRVAQQDALQQQARMAQQQARMAQQLADLKVTQAEVEQGRQALLHDEPSEAQLHLSEAYPRGECSSACRLETMKTKAYAALSATTALAQFEIDRREPGPLDVAIDILFCGVCHSDIHQVRGEWKNSQFPMVPGHEIVGRVARVGDKVTTVLPGDLVGVGCLVDSCRTCRPCKRDHEQFCEGGPAWTYNSTEMDRTTPTYGGYSQHVVVTERFVAKLPAGLDPAAGAPLLCAGITTYSPLLQWGCKAGDRVGVVGLGGLGHMAVKLAVAMGAEVTVFSTAAAKLADARRLGASAFVHTGDASAFT